MIRTYLQGSITSLLLLFLSNILSAQEETGTKQLFVEAESFFLFEEYKDALPLYQKIVRDQPDNYNVIYKIGICYLNDIYQKEKAIKYLEQASQNVNPACKPNNFKEKTSPIDAYYYLGKAYHTNNMLDKAIESYQNFRKLADPAAYNLDIVDEDIAACQLSKQAFNSPIYCSMSNVSSPINSRFEDINPVVSGDGRTLAFTRKLQFYDAVFITGKDSKGSWSEPENLTSSFGLDGSSYTTGISFNGDEIFVYRSDNFDGNIYSSKKKNNQWSKLTKLNENINTKYWESHASPSHDGQFLIFTSNREGGYGGLDIYKSRKKADGDWGEAVNMGPVINSPSNEETPFLSNQGHTIFFSSQGHNTLGGYDIFVSNLRSDGTWSKPKNMGYPLNTTDDDLFYTPAGVNAFGYYSFYDPQSTQGMLDIYYVEVYNELIPRTFTLKGSLHVSNPDPELFKQLKVRLYDAQSKELIVEKAIGNDGAFSLQANQGNYLLTVEGPGIEPCQKNISLAVNQSESEVILQALTLNRTEKPAELIIPPAPEKALIVVKNDFFAVTDDSEIPIELLLPKGSTLDIEVWMGDSLIKKESIKDVKRKFTYFYKPLPGENILKFTATDPEGNVSTTQVIVTYYAPPEPVLTEKITRQSASSVFNPEVLNTISSGALQEYLKNTDLSQFKNFMDLYDHLIAVADEEGFTLEEIQHLYAVYFTQKELRPFSLELMRVSSANTDKWKQIADSSAIPLEFLNRLLEDKLITDTELSGMLLSMLGRTGINGHELLIQLADFSRNSSLYQKSGASDISIQQAWEVFAGETDDKQACEILKLTSTTDDLDFFYQSMLLSSTGGLYNFLAGLKLEPKGIKTSIDLAEFLFRNTSDTTYTTSDLINALQAAAANKDYYLNKFNELLASNATGSLKSQLLLTASEKQKFNTFEGMLNYILNQAKYKNYSQESVYDLLLSLIGIEDVEEFAARIREYGYGAINKAIADTSLTYFSNPFELVQYLLMATQMYDFTQSDLNNLLIRMILERGLDNDKRVATDISSKKLWKSRKFVSTVILVNIILIILIIVFTLRKKKY